MHSFKTNVSRQQTRIYLIPTIIITLTFFLNGTGQAELILFTHNKVIENDAGYMLLSWKNPLRIPVELQQASHSTFVNATTVYRGKNSSIMLSGLSDGTYYYRIRAQGSLWSDTVTLHVSHHALVKAWLLFILGACVFSGIVWVIIRGAVSES